MALLAAKNADWGGPWQVTYPWQEAMQDVTGDVVKPKA
jgi:hypothetical protein